MKPQKFKWPARVLAVLTLLLTTSAWAYTVSGCFVNVNGNGVAGLTVVATGDSTTTGSDGCFAMANVTANTNSLTMSGSGYKSRTIGFRAVNNNDKSANIGQKYVIATTNGYKINLNVLDRATNQHLNGVNFTVTPGTIQVDSSAYVLSVSEPGSYSLTATKANYDSMSVGFSVTDANPITNPGTIKLWGGGYQVIGKVVNSDGNPVSGAQVSLNTGGSATTTSDGTFTLGGIQTATSFTLTATKSGYPTITKTGSVNNSNPVRNLGNITMIAGGYKVIGRVVDINKNPLSGVSMNVNVGGSATTGNDGQFAVTGIMEPASFTLTGTKSGYKDINRNSSVSQSSPVRNMGDVYLIATQNGFRVSGCTTYMGDKLPNVQVTIGDKTTRTGNDGCYTITLDDAGTYNYQIKVVEDIGPSEAIYKLPANGFVPITGRVIITEAQPMAVADGYYEPSLRTSIKPDDSGRTRRQTRDGLGVGSQKLVDGDNIYYTITIENQGNCPVHPIKLKSAPELPTCMSFVSGQEIIDGVSYPIEDSTHPLDLNGGISTDGTGWGSSYNRFMRTPLNCNLMDDAGSSTPYQRNTPSMLVNFYNFGQPLSSNDRVDYPYSGNPTAKTLECRELGLLGGAGTPIPNTVSVKIVVHAESCGGGGGSPFNLGFNAEGINCEGAVSGNTRRGTKDGKSCRSVPSTPAKIVIPPVLPQLNSQLTNSKTQLRLGDGDLSYTITVRNEGVAKSVATGVVLNIPVPTDMTATATIDGSQGVCNIVAGDIGCNLNDMPSSSQVPITVKFTPTKPTVGSGSVQLLSNETDTPQTLALNYTVSRALTECEKNPTCACNPALCPVPPAPPADVALVIDDTGSMSEEISSVRTALSAFINKLADGEAKPVVQLVTFKDNVTHRITTKNLASLRDNHVNRLVASGGNDCPENAGGALAWVADNADSNRLKNGGRILLITDASPHDDTEIDVIIQKLRTRGIRVDVLISGDTCMEDGAKLSSVAEYSKIANETGGIAKSYFGINDPSNESAARFYENAAFSVMQSSLYATIIGATPNVAQQDSTMDMSLTAANTNFKESTTVSFDDGSGITINKLTVVSATELVVNVTISEEAPLGFYNVIAETKLGEDTEIAEGLGIVEITESRGEPEILSIMPTSALQDSEVEVTVYATHSHFNAGSQLTFANPGISVKQMQIKSNTALTATLEIAANAKLGLHHVTVMSGSETATSEAEKFLVMAESKSAKIKALSASRGTRGTMVKFAITGKNTNFAEGVTELRFLKGITVISLTVSSATEASAVILIEPDTQLGYQDVIMITGDEVAVKLNGFEISERGPHAVEGYALDKAGEPVEKVYLAIKGQGAFTDATGYFRMTGLIAGEYTITSDKAGYNFAPETFAVGQPPAEVASVVLKAASELALKIVPDTWQPVKQGGKVTYTITVTNKGNATATGIVLTDILPANTSLAAIEGGECDFDTVSCQLRDLTPNAEATIKVTINNTQTKPLVNVVTVASNEYPPATAKHWKRVMPYLSVAVTGTPDPVVPQGLLHYTLDIDLSPYSPLPATGVKLVTQLPHGVELQAINTDYGVCDSSNLPTISCDIVELNVDNLDGVSHVTIDIDVLLKDPGLLLLTHNTKVSANEHPAHTNRERTEIFVGDVEVDIAFIIDVTGSMQGEINAIIKAMKDFIAKIDPSQAPLIALVTFKDDVKIKAFTTDLNLLRNTIADIKASGGGECPEASVEALQKAIPHVKEGGFILFATDASPYKDADVDTVTQQLRDKGIRFNAMITGDCTMEESWNQLTSTE